MNFRPAHHALIAFMSLALASTAIGVGCNGDDDEVLENNSDGGSSSGGSSSGGSSSGGSSSGGSSSGGSSSGGVTDASTLVQDGTLELRQAGGLMPQVTDASTCQPINNAYTYERTTRMLTWSLCKAVSDSDDVTPVYALESGFRTLTEAEGAPIQTALANLEQVGALPDACPTDGPQTSLRVFADDTTLQTFGEACQFGQEAATVYVKDLDALHSALGYAADPS